jgi:hypothetical protein
VNIAGLHVEDKLVLELALILRERGQQGTALRIERAFDAAADTIRLGIEEREHVLAAVADCPHELGPIRPVRQEEQSGG